MSKTTTFHASTWHFVVPRFSLCNALFNACADNRICISVSLSLGVGDLELLTLPRWDPGMELVLCWEYHSYMMAIGDIIIKGMLGIAWL